MRGRIQENLFMNVHGMFLKKVNSEKSLTKKRHADVSEKL